jgi:hypothetical protein
VSDLSWLWDDPGLLWLAAVALYTLALLASIWRKGTPGLAPLRPIPLFDRLLSRLCHSVEADAPLHLSLGSRGVAMATPEIAQAAALATRMAHVAGAATAPLIVTSGSSTLFVAISAVGRTPPAADSAERGAVQSVLVGAEPLSYAVGAWNVATASRLAGQVCFGPFGPEGLLLQEGARESGAQDSAALSCGLERLAGSAEIDAAALLMLGSTASAVGEDVYAASAYLQQPAHRAGLALQDGVRVCLLLGILIGLGLRLAGVWGG